MREGNTEVGHHELRTLKKTLSVLEKKESKTLATYIKNWIVLTY